MDVKYIQIGSLKPIWMETLDGGQAAELRLVELNIKPRGEPYTAAGVTL